MSFRVRVLLVIFALSLPWLVVLPDVGRLPHNDYYGIVAQLVDDDGSGLTTEASRWLGLKSNEHTVLLPAFVYAGNILLWNGDNRGLSTYALLLLMIELFLITRLLPDEVRRDRLLLVPVVAAAAVLVLAPAGAHSIVMGFSGTIWLTANVFAVGAVVALLRGADDRRVPWVALGLGVLAALSYSTNLGLWPALLVGAAVCRLRRPAWVSLFVTMIAVFGFELVLYSRPPHHAAPVFLDVVKLGGYVLVYLGNPLSGELVSAAVVGCVGCVAAVVVAVKLLRRADRARRLRVAPWVMLQVYVVANALGTAVARVGFAGPQQSRYVCVASLFWVALIVEGLLVVVPGGRWSLRSVRRACAVGTVLLAVVVWWRGAPVLQSYLDDSRWQPLAEVALRRGIEDLKVLRRVSPAPDEILSLREFLLRTGHVPFDRGRRIQREVDVADPCSDITVVLQGDTVLANSVARVELAVLGATPKRPAPRFIDEEGSCVGVIVPRPAPPFSGADLFLGERQWAGYVPLEGSEGSVRLIVPRLDRLWCEAKVGLSGPGFQPTPPARGQPVIATGDV